MKQTLIHILIMVVAVIFAALLATNLRQTQETLIPEKAAMSRMPLGGLHKFASDVEWMLFVNYLGSLNTVDDGNVDEVVRRLEKLISYDPNMQKLYQEGVSTISVADPAAAVRLLKAACNNPRLQNNAQIPFYTGFIMVQHMKPANYKDAEQFFLEAVKRAGSSLENYPYYASYYYRAKAKQLGDGKMEDRLALLNVLYDEWQKSGKTGEADMQTALTGNLRDRLFDALRNVKNASDDYVPSKAALQRADEIAKAVFSDQHLCHNCVTGYQAGDKFCSNCGVELQVWGLCKSCQVPLNPGAKFCGKCGAKAEEVKKSCKKCSAPKAAAPSAKK